MNAGPSRPTSSYRRAPCEPASGLRFHFEIAVVGGEEGRQVRAAQARAIKELLEWMHQQDHPERTPLEGFDGRT